MNTPPKYPSHYQINTRDRLTGLSSELDKPAALDILLRLSGNQPVKE